MTDEALVEQAAAAHLERCATFCPEAFRRWRALNERVVARGLTTAVMHAVAAAEQGPPPARAGARNGGPGGALLAHEGLAR